jgi:uncharacterized membrane protein YfcA
VLLPPIGAAAVYAYYRAGHVDWLAALILATTVPQSFLARGATVDVPTSNAIALSTKSRMMGNWH